MDFPIPILCAGEEVYDLGEEESTESSQEEHEHSTTRAGPGLREKCDKTE